MAMTKAEKQRVAVLEHEVALMKAQFRLPYAPVPLDRVRLASSLKHGDVEVAWLFNTHSGLVERGCFSSVSHSRQFTHKTTTQGIGGPWYQTEVEALKACRDAIAAEAFWRLAHFDQQIAAKETE